jgi:ABC-type Zn uptake system ZnuABC Zn-binding protein ZnuA
MNHNFKYHMTIVTGFLTFLIFTTGCSAASRTVLTNKPKQDLDTHSIMLTLPDLTAADLDGELPKVVATTSIIGDVVAQVGGDVITLTTLMAPGQDPHSYEPGAQALTAVADADVIFINGWGLEESVVPLLQEIGRGVPIIAISANIVPLTIGKNEVDHEEEEREHQELSTVDPHVWFQIQHVIQWVENVEHVLIDLDPVNADTYSQNAAAYQADLAALAAYTDAQFAQIPQGRRVIVTNHDSFHYLADTYQFTLIGTIIPGVSTLAEPSANYLADLISKMNMQELCTIFTETTVNDTLAKTVAAELDNCDEVKIISLYTDSLSNVKSGHDSYIRMFRANVDAIVAGLR